MELGRAVVACLAYYRSQTISKDPAMEVEVGTLESPGRREGLCFFYSPDHPLKIISVYKIGFEELNSKAHNLMPGKSYSVLQFPWNVIFRCIAKEQPQLTETQTRRIC